MSLVFTILITDVKRSNPGVLGASIRADDIRSAEWNCVRDFTRQQDSPSAVEPSLEKLKRRDALREDYS